MLTSKQRAALRGQANKMETILQIGKDGISENTINQVDDALTARELIKLRVLDNCPLTAKEASFELCDALGCDGVQVIGSRFVLFRRNEEKAKYDEFLKK
ncbi:MAG: YhbY family RNA-binding protein [Clostridia bacterium]|nr:YhbY family RNA-binding protein [Clostridia bacterium]